jgi:hypothetical protein
VAQSFRAPHPAVFRMRVLFFTLRELPPNKPPIVHICQSVPICYTVSVCWDADLVSAPQVMLLRHAVLQTSSKSSVSLRLPSYKSRPLPTPSKSTLLEVLISLHFNSLRINTYKKPGQGVPTSTFSPLPVSPFLATLASHRQLAENKTSLSRAIGTLIDRVKHKSFVCRSYKKHPGWGCR